MSQAAFEIKYLGDNVVNNKGESSSVSSLISNDTVYGLYFSAHWCPPCRMFTPQLAKLYTKLKTEGKKFEVIFCSSDKNEGEFNKYMAEMPWHALPFKDRNLKEALSMLFQVSGIPSLVLIKGDGTVITTEGRAAIAQRDFPFTHNKDGSEASSKAAKSCCGGGDEKEKVRKLENEDLYPLIDLKLLAALNTSENTHLPSAFAQGSADRNPVASSTDIADQIMIFVPFVANCKASSFSFFVKTQGEDNKETNPTVVKIWKNSPNLDLSDAESAAPTVQFQVKSVSEKDRKKDDPKGWAKVSFPLSAIKFNSFHHLTLHFSTEQQSEIVQVRGLGIVGSQL